ncbi:MAG: hypothetical protein U0169_19430, partial [Polyangiaceae bacterium]
MKRSVSAATILASIFVGTVSAWAAKPTAAPAAPQEAPVVKSVRPAVAALKCPHLPPSQCALSSKEAEILEGFTWGAKHTDVAKAYTRTGGIFDKEVDAVLKNMSNGSREQMNKESERDQKKQALENAYVVFGNNPTGYDALAIGSLKEFTYRNKEAIQTVDQETEQGTERRYFFYIGDPNERLYKIWIESSLGPKSPYGKSFAEVATKVNSTLGAAGLDVPPGEGHPNRTMTWSDGTTQLRLVDLGAVKFALVLENLAMVKSLPQLRANQPEDPFALDPAVTNASKGGVSDPNRAAAPAPSNKP